MERVLESVLAGRPLLVGTSYVVSAALIVVVVVTVRRATAAVTRHTIGA
jgi:hypothetical protein